MVIKITSIEPVYADQVTTTPTTWNIRYLSIDSTGQTNINGFLPLADADYTANATIAGLVTLIKADLTTKLSAE